MPSPFPGMDPYLERDEVWYDFHKRFIVYAAEILGTQFEKNYVVLLNDQVYVRDLPVDESPLTELRPSILQVRRLTTFEIVTVIELLTPPQKISDHQRSVKRRSYLEKGISLVEIDLLRGGARVPITGMPECDYCVLIARAEKDSRIAVWPIHLRQCLPIVPIPLREPDHDVILDIQKLIGRTCDAAGYKDYIYEKPVQPPLSDDDALWARAIVREAEAS